MKLTMVGRLSDCVLLTYRTPAASVIHLVPPELKLVTFGEWAFWNIVACRVSAMRPAGWPRWLGMDYLHVAYRLYVRAGTLDGLFFVRSDASNGLICLAGNLLTDFRFHRAKITISAVEDRISLLVGQAHSGTGNARLHARMGEALLAADSVFKSYTEAQSFLKYRPAAISVDRRGRVRHTQVTRDESAWRESPLSVIEADWALFRDLGQRPELELATRVAPIDYSWHLGSAPPASFNQALAAAKDGSRPAMAASS